jgi:LysR family transcriptional regulator for metE and metH
VDCHTSIEWLAPTLDRYRRNHPQVYLDLRMGASFDPLPSLKAGSTDLVITAEHNPRAGSRSGNVLSADPLFSYPIVALLRRDHPLANRPVLTPKDFIGETVITYPVAECRLDLYTRFLDPAGVVPSERRTAELTTIIIQWVTGGVGIAALPQWTIPSGHPKLAMVPLGTGGLWADLYAFRRQRDDAVPHFDAFIQSARTECFASLDGIDRISR